VTQQTLLDGPVQYPQVSVRAVDEILQNSRLLRWFPKGYKRTDRALRQSPSGDGAMPFIPALVCHLPLRGHPAPTTPRNRTQSKFREISADSACAIRSCGFHAASITPEVTPHPRPRSFPGKSRMDRSAGRANPLRGRANFPDRKGRGGDGGIRRRDL